MINKEQDILIEQYLSGSLSQKEQIRFEQLIEKNPEIKQALAEQSLIQEAAIEYGLQDIRKKLEQIHQKQQGEKKSRLLKRVLAGSLIAGLAIGSYFIFNSPGKDSNLASEFEQQTQTDSPVNEEKNVAATEPGKTKNNLKPQIQDKNTNKEIENKQTNNKLVVNDTNQRKKEISPVQLNTKRQKQITVFKDSLNTQEIAVNIENPCNKAFNLELISRPSCYENATGKIIIINKNDTETPYSIFRQEEKFILNDSLIYKDLSHGAYHFKIESINKCDTNIRILIDGKDCRPSLKFAPAYGETLNIPLRDKSNGIIIIRSKSGEILVEESVGAAPFFTWDGRASSGGYVPMGVYSYTISYKSGAQENGFITVLR